MSSAAYIDVSNPVDLDDWRGFCDEVGIVYNPHTVGQNVFYAGQVEIHFGEANFDELPKLPSGRYDFDKASPYRFATKLSISSYWGQNLQQIADTVALILPRWPGRVTCDPELLPLLPTAQEPTED